MDPDFTGIYFLWRFETGPLGAGTGVFACGRCALAAKTKSQKIRMNISSFPVNKEWFFLKCRNLHFIVLN
jgi:hypothetical protein